ncbi:11610_t:CDS:2 [Acaulospora morrowiae]|uniref:11610_t:CDS:1 n=1 Tax=Acaulospora morrowiae TaxID=94023 RepID=A0A9N9EHA1_9GLOM|nr:11610_t:CDS:2 [Acaulospora morrowiae]
MVFGKVVHVAVDAVLVSAVLAGIKRSSGLSLVTSNIENQDLRKAVDKFLDVGEWVVDQELIRESCGKLGVIAGNNCDNNDHNAKSKKRSAKKILCIMRNSVPMYTADLKIVFLGFEGWIYIEYMSV